jgi:hypothetical protein
MDNIPESWSGAVIAKWNDLISRQGLLWDFSFETRGESGDIFLAAMRKIRTDDNLKLEIVHPVDFDNSEKVCEKIAALEKQVQRSNAATA